MPEPSGDTMVPKHIKTPKGIGILLRRPAILCVAIWLLVLIVYGRTLSVPFYFDDYSYVAQNPLIASPGSLFDRELIVSAEVYEDVKNSVLTRPVSYLSFALNHLLDGTDVRGYHLVNILIHACNASLVFAFMLLAYRSYLARLEASGQQPLSSSLPDQACLAAGAVAALFAVHPVMTNAVTYITQRMASLATLFCLLAMVSYARALLSGEAKARACWYILALAACAASMGSKMITFTMPLLLTFYDLIFCSGTLLRRALRLAPFFAMVCLAAVLLLGRGVDVTEAGGTQKSIQRAVTYALASPLEYMTTSFATNTSAASFESITPIEYLASQVRVQATYLRLLLVPTGLAFVREADLYRSLTDIPVLLSATLHISLVAVAILMLRRSRNDAGNAFFLRTAVFGIFWFYVALLMESSIIPQDDLVLEHRLYFPAFGGLTALVSVFFMIRREYLSTESAGGILVLAVCVLAVLTILRNEQWRDPLAFWQDNMVKSPDKTRIHGYIGNLYMNRGETSKALQEYKKAFSGDYRYGQDHYVLGNMFFEQNMYRDAVEEYLAALRIRPDKHEIYLNLAEAYRMLGENTLSEMAEQRFVEGRSASEKKR